MRLLADENVHGKVVAWLREHGFRLDWVKEIARSADDADLLARPDMASTVLITNDRDFGELIFGQGLPPPLAILYTRTEHRDWLMTASILAEQLRAGIIPGQITTLSKTGIRHRAFPTGANNG